MAGPESCVSPAAAMPAAGSASLPGALLMLTKPGIVLAESAAGLAGMLLACRGLPPSATVVFWCLLSLIMAASGAAMVNCVLEADTDRKMTRLTDRSRALATAGRARVMTIALLLMGGAFLLTGIFLNFLTLLLLTTACGSYLLLYTLWLKRRSSWNVLGGAVPGALPPLIGAAAVTGSVSALPLLLGCVIFIWQFPHFWFLALQYSDQYRQAGTPVLPLTHGIKLTKRLTLLSSTALLPVTLSFSLLGRLSAGFTSAVLLTGIFFPLLCHRFLYRTGEYRKGFILSLAYLAVIFVALITDISLR
jgi:heme o synthase